MRLGNLGARVSGAVLRPEAGTLLRRLPGGVGAPSLLVALGWKEGGGWTPGPHPWTGWPGLGWRPLPALPHCEKFRNPAEASVLRGAAAQQGSPQICNSKSDHQERTLRILIDTEISGRPYGAVEKGERETRVDVTVQT